MLGRNFALRQIGSSPQEIFTLLWSTEHDPRATVGNLLPAAVVASHHTGALCLQSGRFFPLGSHSHGPRIYGGLSSSEVLIMKSLPEHLWVILVALPTILVAQRYHRCPKPNTLQLSLYSLKLLIFSLILVLVSHVCCSGLGTLSCSCAVSSASTQYYSSRASLGREEAAGVASVVRCQKLPPCQSVPAGSKMDPLLAKTEPDRDADRDNTAKKGKRTAATIQILQ